MSLHVTKKSSEKSLDRLTKLCKTHFMLIPVMLQKFALNFFFGRLDSGHDSSHGIKICFENVPG